MLRPGSNSPDQDVPERRNGSTEFTNVSSHQWPATGGVLNTVATLSLVFSKRIGGCMISNQSYFARRALQEAARASRARSVSAQQWHQELADKFQKLAAEAVEEPVRELVAA